MPAKKAPSGPHNGGTRDFWAGSSIGPARKTVADNTAAKAVGGSGSAPISLTDSQVISADDNIDYSPVSDAENAALDKKFSVKSKK